MVLFYPQSHKPTGVFGRILATFDFLQPKEISKMQLPVEE